MAIKYTQFINEGETYTDERFFEAARLFRFCLPDCRERIEKDTTLEKKDRQFIRGVVEQLYDWIIKNEEADERLSVALKGKRTRQRGTAESMFGRKTKEEQSK